MADILDLQDHQPEQTPGAEKASTISYLRVCWNSYLSVSLCFVK